MNEESRVRILVTDEELDAAIAGAGLHLNPLLSIEEMRLVAADVSVCLGAAVALGEDDEFSESMAGMQPPQSPATSSFGIAYFDHLIAALREEEFAAALMIEEVGGRLAQIRHWLGAGVQPQG